MTQRTLMLYGHNYCHLCAEMQQALEPWRQRFGFALELVNIEGRPDLEEHFGERVPVLVEEGREICHYFLDEAALLERLGTPV